MSRKVTDVQGRWRSKTVSFRMSPEENALLDSYRTMKEQNWTPKLLIGQRAGFTATETVDTVGAVNMNDTLSTNLFALDLSVTNPNVKIVNDMFKEYQAAKGFVADAASGADMNDA